MTTTFVPTGIPAGFAKLIQPDNILSGVFLDVLLAHSRYAMDAEIEELPPGMGRQMNFTSVGTMSADLRPVPPLGEIPRGSWAAEQWSARPLPYGNAVDLDAPSAYVAIGNRETQGVTRLAEWAGRTKGRIARDKLFAAYLSGQSIIRRAQTTSDSVLLVTSLAGFRNVLIGGTPTPVSSTNTLPITIVAATTFTALVTGTTPVDPDFPDGPGQLTLSTTLSASAAANSYCYVTSSKPFVQRPGGRASTEALLVTDLPTVQDILSLKAKLVDQGVMPHASTGTYHVHVDAFFFVALVNDATWKQAFQGDGMSAFFGPGSVFVPSLGLTFIENNDSPAQGKGQTVIVGSAATTVGATGTPASSVSMQDIGIDLVNSSGVVIRRAIVTGEGVMKEVFVDETKYIELIGGQVIHKITSNLSVYNVGGMQLVAGTVDRWRLLIRPPLDTRALVATLAATTTLDYAMRTDSATVADTSDTRLFKRAAVLEYGSAV